VPNITKLELDHDAIAATLKSSEVAAAIHGLAEQVAAQVREAKPDADVIVDDYTTDRAASSVTIRDARGRLWQVQDGVLTRAAAAVGLEVNAE
jgi:hypothetical protein